MVLEFKTILKFIPAASFGVLVAFSALAQGAASRPQVPIIVGMEADMDACGSNGVVAGLDPQGDGFLAVKAGPSLNAPRIDKLYNGAQVYICQQRGDWYGIVYSRTRQDCNVSSPWPRALPYTGPCRSGWAHRRWINVYAG